VKSFLWLAALAPSLACGTGSATEQTTEARVVVDEAVKKDLSTLRGAHVFFGHHSVGANILEGLAELSKETGIDVKIDEAPVGENTKPLGKFEDFAKRGEANPADGTQVMAMKLCYVDFRPDTNVGELVQAYASAVERVKKARPGVRIVHVTPPLMVRPADLKSKISRTLGKSIWEDEANAKRLEFKQKMLERFPGDPVFDLSAVESTRPDGTREEYVVDGKKVPMLWPGYSNDGGHLNGTGQLVAAKAFAHAFAAALGR
jgi:hypothetical protein